MRIEQRFLSYWVAIASSIMALLLSLWLEPIITRTIGAFFYISIAITTWYGGRKPGMLAVLLSGLALDYYFFPSLHQFQIAYLDDLPRLLLVAVVGFIINLLTSNLQESTQAATERNLLLQQEQATRANAEHLLQKLDAERHRLEQVLQQMPVGVAIAESPSGKLLFHNDEAIRLLGHPLLKTETYQSYSEYGAVHSDGQLYQPEDYPMSRSLLSGQVVKAEEMLYRKGDGTTTLFSVSATPIRDQAGHIISTVATFEDIHDRKQLELSLQTSEAKLSEILNNAGASIVSMRIFSDCSWEYDYYSAGCEAIFGYTATEMVQDIWWSRILPEDQETVILPGLNEIVAGRSTRMVYRFQHKDGSLRWISTDLSTHWDPQHNCWQAIAVDTDISDRKQAELALRANEENLRLLLHHAPVGIAMFDREMRYITMSQRWLDDYHPGAVESYIGRSHYEVLPAIPDHYKEIHQRCLAGAVERGEGYFTGTDGIDQWTRWEVRPWYQLSGEIGGIVIFSEYINDRKQAELALQELHQSLERRVAEQTTALRTSEIRTRAMIAAIPDLLFWVKRDGTYLDVMNSRNFNLLNSASLIPGTSVYDSLPYDLAQQRIEAIQRALATGEVQVYEQRLEIEGEPQDEEVRIAVCGEDEVLLMVRDITARKRAEENLQESQRFIQQIADASPNLLYLYDVQQQRNIYSNRDTGSVLGYTPEQLRHMGETFLQQVMHPDDLAHLPAHWERLSLSQASDVTEHEYRMKQANGEWRWFYSRDVVFHRDREGRVQQILGTAQDITNLKQAQHLLAERNQQLAISNQELARATRLKDEFLANMSHELRTPLNAILGMTEGLQDEVFGTINDRQQQSLQTIEQAGVHLLELINDVLDLAKVESGQIELNYTSTDINVLCQTSLALIEHQALKKELQVELNVTTPISSLSVDKRRIRQVLVNLLNNAVKFTPNQGHITLEVSVLIAHAGEVEKPWVRFAVLDTGIGIASENIPKLFQPFIQIDGSLNRQYEGTGLGLALVKRIVELHGGKVGVSSEVGIGSCFTVDLPYEGSPISTPDRQLSGNANLQENPTDLTQSPLILLVEDNEANMMAIVGYLEMKGNRLVSASNGQAAIALVQSAHPDLILMDIQMPGMDGLEAIRQIRSLPHVSKIPIIALTALAMEGDRERCLAAGANAYLSKPVKLKQLANQIHQLLQPASI
ncbi:PAS domain S-box protein [Leptolyngbya sp. AN02str]|uniref:PAS domain S-box protein n=1 Tax=Leptolyngbya sp. AN02str TaxID=3423363 RepID=UPI003D317B27